MPIDRSVPTRGVNSSRAAIRANFVAIDDKIGGLPEDYDDLGGRLVIVKANESGIDVGGPADFATDPVRGGVAVVVGGTGARLIDSASTGTLQRADDAGDVAWNLEADDVLVGTTVAWCQAGAGIITFVPQAGAELKSFAGHARSAGQDATGVLTCWALTDSGKARWYLSGTTQP